MQEKTNGIVLHTVKHTDSTSIATIYTQQFGRVAYMIYGTGKKKAVCRSAFFQPLSIVEIDVSHIPSKEIQRIKDIRIAFPLINIPAYPVKNAIALFLSETLFRILIRTESDEQLYRFLETSILYLDICECGLANFHLVFLLKLAGYLGFEPNIDEQNDGYFDLAEGVFLREKPFHKQFLSLEESADLQRMLLADFDTMSDVVLSREKRVQLLENIITFYKLHIPDFHGVHSLEVLQSLFD